MLNELEFKRYHSHLMLDWLGVEGQLRLKKAKILCVGAGGLASPLLYYLVAAGIGTIGIIDDDIVAIDNLSRQILYRMEDLGKQKVLSAKHHLQKINPYCKIKIFSQKLQPENAKKLIRQFDIVADCTDNFRSKLLINDVAFQEQKPFVTASARQHLGHFLFLDGLNGPCYRCVFEELPLQNESCHETGVFAPLLAILASFQITEIIKFLSGFSKPNCHLIKFNAFSLEQTKIRLQSNTHCILNHSQHRKKYSRKNKKAIKEITSLSTLADKDFLLIDVRTLEEHQARNMGGLCIPLDRIQEMKEISKTKCLVLYCNSGKRSRLAAEFLKSEGFKNIYCLLAWA